MTKAEQKRLEKAAKETGPDLLLARMVAESVTADRYRRAAEVIFPGPDRDSLTRLAVASDYVSDVFRAELLRRLSGEGGAR